MGWLDVPWLSDLRLNANGQPRLFFIPTLKPPSRARAVALAESRGFALQPTIYLELGAQAAPELLAGPRGGAPSGRSHPTARA